MTTTHTDRAAHIRALMANGLSERDARIAEIKAFVARMQTPANVARNARLTAEWEAETGLKMARKPR